MSVIVINHRYELRYGTAAEWTTSNPVLREGEPGIESDTQKWKVGNGSQAWVDLDYMAGEASGGGAVDSVNGQTGVVVLDAADVGAVVSVNGETGVVSLSSADVGADAAGTAASAVAAFGATLGNSATLDVGTTAGTVAAGDDARFGAGGSDPWVFRVSENGAVGDNSTNDRAAIQDTIDAAVAYAVANEYYAEVHFDPLTYYIGSTAPDQESGTGFGQYAMLRIPEIPQTGRKLTLVFKGVEAGDPMLHWLAETPQRTGTVIRANPSGLSPQTINGVNVAPSIIGGPLHSGGNEWTNVYAVIQGISLLVPENTGIMGFDLWEVANARIIACSCHVQATVLGAGGNPTIGVPTNDLAMALRMPQLGNNDLSYVDSFSCEGWYYGFAPGDHCHVNRLAIIYGIVGLYIYGSGTHEHGITIGNLSIEANQEAGIQVGQTSGYSIPIHIAALHMETSGGVVVDDAGGHLKGEIHWHAISNTFPAVNGAGNVRIVNERMARGAKSGTVDGVAVPSIPASGTPLVNPYWRDAIVAVTGGTVTAIAVDGVPMGITNGPVVVPTGKSITLTYSSAPTWAWVTL